MKKSKANDGICWYCGTAIVGNKCNKCGATQDKAPKMGHSALGSPRIHEATGMICNRPYGVRYPEEEFKMPSPVKQPGRKPLDGQPPLKGNE